VRIGPTYQEIVRPGPNGLFIAGGRVQPVEADGKLTGLLLNSRGARDFRLTRVSP
jgi:hypothetical protein